MAASDPERCRENALNAVRARWARTAPQRAAKELTDWAERSAAALEPLAPHEIAAVGRLAAIIDARVSGEYDGDPAGGTGDYSAMASYAREGGSDATA